MMFKGRIHKSTTNARETASKLSEGNEPLKSTADIDKMEIRPH